MQPPISQQKYTSSIPFHFLKHIWTRCLLCVKQERRRERGRSGRQREEKREESEKKKGKERRGGYMVTIVLNFCFLVHQFHRDSQSEGKNTEGL